jgi:hypothetical protein
VHDVTDVQILKYYVSDADSTSVFRQEALKILGPLDKLFSDSESKTIGASCLKMEAEPDSEAH